MLAHARARRRWRRPAGAGAGPGAGSGLGSLPGLVLFEPGVAGMGYSAARTKPAPLRYPIRSSPPANGCLRTDPNRPPTAVGKPSVRLGGWTVVQLNGCDGSVRTVATVDFWRTRMPSRSAINSAPDFHSKTHKTENISLSLPLFEF